MPLDRRVAEVKTWAHQLKLNMKNLKILLLYPEVPETFWSLTHALRFFGKRTHATVLFALKTALPKEGFKDVRAEIEAAIAKLENP